MTLLMCVHEPRSMGEEPWVGLGCLLRAVTESAEGYLFPGSFLVEFRV